MPYAYAARKTPKGREYIEAIATETVDIDSANDFNDRFRKGGLYGGKPMLVVLSDGTKFTVEGRKALTSGNGDTPLIAVVVTSAPVRVMLNFMLKASAAMAPADAPALNLRSFTKPPEAVAWLDEELDKKAR